MTFPMPFFMPSASEQTVTWNPSDKDASVTLSNGDLDASVTDSSFSMVRATLGRSTGKYCWEIRVTSGTISSSRCGFANSGHSLTTFVGNSAKGGGTFRTGTSVNTYTKVWTGQWFASGGDTAGDYYFYAFDATAGKVWVSRNGTYGNSGDPAAGTGEWVSGIGGDTIYPAFSGFSAGTVRLITKAADFSEAIPSGFSSWASA